MADTRPLPSWYAPEPSVAAAASPGQSGPLPSWYAPEPESATVTADRTPSLVKQAGDVAANVGTGLLRVPGAVLGIPQMLGHTLSWVLAHAANTGAAAAGKDVNLTGADLDKYNPVAAGLPSSETIDSFIENPPHPKALDFLFNSINDPSKPAQFYRPESFGGRLLQAGVTGAASGGTGLVGKAKMALAADAATASNEVFPENPALAAAAALVTHGGAGAAASAAKRGYRTFAEPIARPRTAGEALAGKSLIDADHTQPGLANPARADLDYATDQTRAAVADIGDGADDYTAGGNIRNDLQARKDQLVAGRKAATETSRTAFEGEPPMSVQKLEGFLSRPGFRRAMINAGQSVMDEGGKPTVRYWDVEGGGAPSANVDGVPGIRIKVPALPPEVLDRIKGHLDDAVNEARPGSRQQRTSTILRDQFRGLLDEQYPNTYPKTRSDYAAHSRPLDPLTEGQPGKVLDGETQFGRQTYTMPQDKIAGTFLQSKALRSDYDALIKAYGGDKPAALKNLEENLANKVQGAITGDGTLSLDAFNRTVRPYTKALGMWFPQLAQKFSSAEAAQRTLETVKGQRDVAADVTSGALRGEDGFITGSTFNRWLDRNEAKLAGTQSKAAVMRLRQIAKALPDSPGAGPEAAVESAPMVVGGMLGGLEGGVLGGITHKIPAYLAGPRLAVFRDAYSSALERAVTDPAAAQKLVALAAKRGGSQAIGKMLWEDAKKAALAAPAATLAGKPLGD